MNAFFSDLPMICAIYYRFRWWICWAIIEIYLAFIVPSYNLNPVRKALLFFNYETINLRPLNKFLICSIELNHSAGSCWFFSVFLFCFHMFPFFFSLLVDSYYSIIIFCTRRRIECSVLNLFNKDYIRTKFLLAKPLDAS